MPNDDNNVVVIVVDERNKQKKKMPNRVDGISDACFHHGYRCGPRYRRYVNEQKTGNNFCFSIGRFLPEFFLKNDMVDGVIGGIAVCTVSHMCASVVRTCVCTMQKSNAPSMRQQRSHMVGDATKRKYESQFSIIRITCVRSFVIHVRLIVST